jgi:hypothetical protein
MFLMSFFYFLLGLAVFLIVYYLGQQQKWFNEQLVNVFAVILFFFFLVVSGTYFKNLKNKDAGLLIGKDGLHDKLSSISVGFIPWKEITKIEKLKTGVTQIILIHVIKPQKYIDGAKNGAIKRLLNQNLTLHKTPICLHVGALKNSSGEVENLLKEHYQRFGRK